MIKSAGLVGDCFTRFNASLAKIHAADSGGGFPLVWYPRKETCLCRLCLAVVERAQIVASIMVCARGTWSNRSQHDMHIFFADILYTIVNGAANVKSYVFLWYPYGKVHTYISIQYVKNKYIYISLFLNFFSAIQSVSWFPGFLIITFDLYFCI